VGIIAVGIILYWVDRRLSRQYQSKS